MRIRVQALCSYPVQAAATRYRLQQFVEPLAAAGIDLVVNPFLSPDQFQLLYSKNKKFRLLPGLLSSFIRRCFESFSSRDFDALLIQREAMFFGPEIFERLSQTLGGIPMILDLDDATYVPYRSPRFGRIGSALKFFGKTARLIERADVVVCGNRFIAEYVESRGTRAEVIPTIVNNDVFVPSEKPNKIPVLGWIGTHSTFPSLKSIFPVLEKLAMKHRFELLVVGAGEDYVKVPGVTVDNRRWSLEREVVDFQSIDIGLYPIKLSDSANLDWLKGKSGFKAVQYLSVGIPFVMSPVGVCGEMGRPGETHFNAESDEDWYNSLDRLLSDKQVRSEMGKCGRKHSLEFYSLDTQVVALSKVIRNVVRDHSGPASYK